MTQLYRYTELSTFYHVINCGGGKQKAMYEIPRFITSQGPDRPATHTVSRLLVNASMYQLVWRESDLKDTAASAAESGRDPSTGNDNGEGAGEESGSGGGLRTETPI